MWFYSVTIERYSQLESTTPHKKSEPVKNNWTENDAQAHWVRLGPQMGARTHAHMEAIEREANRKQSSWFVSAKSFRLFLFPPCRCVFFFCRCAHWCHWCRHCHCMNAKMMSGKIGCASKYENAALVWRAQFFRSLEYIIALCIRLNAAEDKKKNAKMCYR